MRCSHARRRRPSPRSNSGDLVTVWRGLVVAACRLGDEDGAAEDRPQPSGPCRPSVARGPPWTPVSCTAAWPLPRAITAVYGQGEDEGDGSAKARAPQNRALTRPESIAPGTKASTALSTISMTAIENVSEASAIGTTAPRRGRRAGAAGW